MSIIYDIDGTKQEIFDRVVKHLAQQGEPALANTGSTYNSHGDLNCAYRTSDDKRCAAGCLIPDDKYKPSFENVTFTGLIEKGKITCNPDLDDLINDLQWAHDLTDNLAELHRRLQSVAVKRHLNGSTIALITEWRVQK